MVGGWRMPPVMVLSRQIMQMSAMAKIVFFLLGTLLLVTLSQLGYEECVSQLVGCLLGLPFGLTQHSTQFHDPYLLRQLCVDVVGTLQYIINSEEPSYPGVYLTLWITHVLLMVTISILRHSSFVQLTMCKKAQYHGNVFTKDYDRITVYSLLSAAALVYLLLKSGDIELNPGPGQQLSEDVDDSTILCEDDLNEVLDAVKNLSAEYYGLGVRLGVDVDHLDGIRKNFSHDARQALMEMLVAWLVKTDHEKKGFPTWQRLVKSVNYYNHRMAKSIASQHQKNDVVQNGCQIQVGDSEELKVAFVGRGTPRYRRLNPTSIPDKFCSDLFVAYYLRQADECTLPTILRREFINVVLVENATTWRRTLSGSMDEVVNSKEKSSYNKIIDTLEHLPKKFILFEGRPGSGKTTLMRKISSDWANGKILQSKLVVYVPLRKLSVQVSHNLFAIIGEACPPLKGSTDKLPKLVSYIERKEGEGVVFVFDGLDEYKPRNEEVTSRSICCCFRSPTSERTTEDTVHEILSGRYLPKAIIFVASRPSTCERFRRYAGKLVEVIGFLKDQIALYIREYFRQDSRKADLLISHLHQHPNLMNMAYLPLHCAMLTVLFDEEEVLPETETQVYRDFTLSTLARSILKKRDSITSKLTKFDQLPPDEKESFYKVCELAYSATFESKLVFSLSDINKIVKPSSSINDDTSLGLIVIDHYFMRHGPDATYTFLHVTFQEYLAAVYVIHTFSDRKVASFIKEHCQSTALAESAMWKFLCGMMDFDKSSACSGIKELLLSTLPNNSLTAINYAYEAQHLYPCVVTVTHLIQENRITFSGKTFTPTDCAALGYVIRNGSKQGVELSLSNCDCDTEGATSLLRHIEDKLTTLHLLQGQALYSILQCMEHIPLNGLRCLGLRRAMIRDSGTFLLKKALGNCIYLEDLNLWKNQITSDGAQALRDGLMNCPNIIKLNLTQNQLGDDGIKILLSCFVKCDSLTTLKLSDNGLTDAAVPSLSKIIQTCKSLYKLQMTHNKFTENGRKELEKVRLQRNSSSQFSIDLENVNFV